MAINFKGFATGDRVTIDGVTAASWSGDTSTGIWDEPASAGTNVTINVIRSAHRIAPEGVFFNLTLSGFDTNTLPTGRYDPCYGDKYVFWDYQEAYDFNAPAQVLAVDVADGGNRKNARYSRGPLGSHVFRTSGVYTVRAAVLEPASGKIGFGSVTVNVGDPDTFYSGSATLFVDTSRSYANAPVGARQFSNVDAALAAMDAAVTPHRIMLERGQTHIFSSSFNYRPPAGSSATSLRIEARQGGGARPIIAAGNGLAEDSDLITDNSLRDISNSVDTGTVLRGIDFRGPWDPETLNGRSIDCIVPNGSHSSKHILVDDCEFTGWQRVFNAIHVNGNAPDRTMFFNDISVHGFRTTVFLGGSNSVLSFTGCGFVQHVDAVTNQTPSDNSTLSPVRVTSSRMCNIWACDLFSATGWSAYRSISAIQPGLRWNTSPAVTGAMLNLQACVVESGRLALSLKPQTGSQPRRLANGVVEGNVAISGFQGDAVVHSAFGGMTYRNNVFVMASQKNSSSIGGQNQVINGLVYFNGGAQSDPANESTPVAIYNNTFVNLTSTNAPLIGNKIGMSAWTEANNLIHQPTRGEPYAGLAAAPAFTPRYKGYRPSASTLHTQFANSAESGSLWIPQLDSPALGAVFSEPDSCLDFRGNRRPEPPSLGAFETD